MSLSKREKIMLIIAGIFVVFFLYYLLFFQPYTKEMADLRSKTTDVETELSTREQMVMTKALMAKQIEENEAAISELSVGITKGYDQPAILAYLEKIVNRYAQKSSFVFREVNQSGYLFVSPVTVTLSTDYPNLKKILSAFSEGEYFIRVTRLNVTSKAPNLQAQPEEEQAPPQNEQQPTDQEQPQEERVVLPLRNLLEVTMELEFYCINDEAASNESQYVFSQQYNFGNDLFR